MKLYLMPLTGQKALTIDNLEVIGNLHKTSFSRVMEMKACLMEVQEQDMMQIIDNYIWREQM